MGPIRSPTPGAEIQVYLLADEDYSLDFYNTWNLCSEDENRLNVYDRAVEVGSMVG